MNLEEYSGHDALGLAALVRSGDISAKELALLAASGVEKVNPTLNAVIEVYRDRVDELDESTLPEGLFAGVPFFMKDLGPQQKGRQQDSGSRLMCGDIAQSSSFITTKMEQSGLNIIGRTTCPEFGLSLTTESVLTGATCNPWDLSRIAGGSSGGSSAMVAAGVVPMAHTNDGAGSTRIPASICGNVGMKHSRGRISHAPVASDLGFPLFSEGVNAHSVRDVAAFLDAVHGPAPGEAVPYAMPARPFLDEVKRDPGKLKIGVSFDPWGSYRMDEPISEELKRVAGICEDLGHILEPATPSLDFNHYFKLLRDMWCIDFAASVDQEALRMGREVSADTLEPTTLKMYQAGIKATAAERLQITGGMNVLSRQLGLFFEEFDVLLTPTLARATPPLGSHANLQHADLDLDSWFDYSMSLVPSTTLNNLTGTPAISLPLATDPNGLPLGMHFMAAMGRDDRLLQLAGQLEQAAPWTAQLPPVHITS